MPRGCDYKDPDEGARCLQPADTHLLMRDGVRSRCLAHRPLVLGPWCREFRSWEEAVASSVHES